MFFPASSSTSAFGSPLLFGQITNSNASSTNPFGSHSGQSSSTNIFGNTSTSAGGTSMGLFGTMQGAPSSPIVWGSSSASMTSSTNGFGSQVGFGQSINPNISFAGSSAPQNTFGQGSNHFRSAFTNGGTSTGVFGQPTGSSFGKSSNIFGSVLNNGGTSTGVFGQPASSSSFGQSSNIFGSALNNNSGTSTRVFGQTASSSSFGQSSNFFGPALNNGGTSTGVFGQPASISSFGQSSNIFGFAPNNGGQSTGVFGQSASISSFGQSSNIFGSAPNNGGTSVGVFGQPASSSSCGQGSNFFGSVPNNSGRLTGLCGTNVSSSPFSVPPSDGIVSPISSALITTSSSPILWSSSTGSTTFSQVPATIVSSSSGFSSGQTTVPWLSSSLSGSNTFSFGTQSSLSGHQVGAPNFGPSDKSSFGEKRGSRVTSYTKTSMVDEKGLRKMLVSISAMPSYENKSHEELRWDDHHQCNAGQYSFLNPAPPSVSSNPFSTTVTRPSTGQHSFLNLPPSVPSNPFATAVTPPSTGQHSFLNLAPPSSVPSNPFAMMPPSTGQHSFLNPAPPSSVPFNPFATTLTPPSTGQHSFLNPAPPSSVPSNPFATAVTPPSTGQHSILNTAPPSSVPSNPFATELTPPLTGQHSFLNSAPPSVPSNPFATAVKPPSTGQYSFLNPVPPTVPSNPEVKQLPSANPFGTPSTVPQMLSEGTRTATPARYGISSIPVADKPAPSKSPSLLHIRHLSCHRQRWLPIQKYKPRSDVPKVAFFDVAQKTPTTAKKEAPLLPRSNPRAFISGIYEELNISFNFSNTSFEKNTATDTYKNGKVELSAPDHDGSLYQDKKGISSETIATEHNRNTDSVHGNHLITKEISLNVCEMMPKLKHSDYFFEPRVEELAIKESYEPGFCSHVKGFVVGRQGYGSIKFLEEIDVRELDLESFIQFKNREVIVYMDESKKPPVGQGLNKAAEITLCNIKFVDKKSGNQYVNGPNVDKFKEKLMKKTEEQGAEFVSYNPVQGEWKFRVKHF